MDSTPTAQKAPSTDRLVFSAFSWEFWLGRRKKRTPLFATFLANQNHLPVRFVQRRKKGHPPRAQEDSHEREKKKDSRDGPF